MIKGRNVNVISTVEDGHVDLVTKKDEHVFIQKQGVRVFVFEITSSFGTHPVKLCTRFRLDEDELDTLIQHLVVAGKIVINNDKRL